jgi:DNA-binding PadR family transcriptional regulator
MTLLIIMSQSLAPDETAAIDHDLSAFQRNILVIIAEQARYGLAIKGELEDYYESTVNHGRLYPNLDTLVEKGLVEKSQRDRRTNEYALTEAGHDAIVTQLSWVCSRFITSHSRAEELHELVEDTQ